MTDSRRAFSIGNICCLAVLVAVQACWVPVRGFSDTVVLSGSAIVKGNILEDNRDANPSNLIVELDPELKIAVQGSRVVKVEYDKGFKNYLAWREAAGEDAEKHYQLARQCRAQGFDELRNYHMRRTIALDPEHSAARSALGYVKTENGWIQYSEQQRNRGLILYGGDYKPPEAVAIEKQKDANQRKVQEWNQKLLRLRKGFFSKVERVRTQAMAEIQALDDPYATNAIATEFEKSRTVRGYPRELRLLWLRKLIKYQNPESVRALVMAGVHEPDTELREEALQALTEFGHRSAVAYYVPRLRPPNKPSEIRAALRALSYFVDAELWPAYVDALVTIHKVRLPSGPGMSTTFSKSGGPGGLSTGGKEKIIEQPSQNAEALDLLREIAPGVDFGYDQKAWREHFASQLNQYSGGLRRDP